MNNINKVVNWLTLTSEITHIFCCGLPLVVSTISLLSGLGFMIGLPGPVDALHHAMHDYEIPLITFSAAVLALGWALHYISIQLDCRTTGCSHGPCQPKKKQSNKILIFATILFVVNVTAYFALHH